MIINALKFAIRVNNDRFLGNNKRNKAGECIDQKDFTCVGEARAIWDVGHYGTSLYLQNSESSNCMCVFHYSSVIWRLRRASNIYIL